MLNGLCYHHSSDWSISNITMFLEIPAFYANSVDPDQPPHFAASDLGLHGLPVSLLRDVRLKRVKLLESLIVTGIN